MEQDGDGLVDLGSVEHAAPGQDDSDLGHGDLLRAGVEG
jgi:hypothetical protein